MAARASARPTPNGWKSCGRNGRTLSRGMGAVKRGGGTKEEMDHYCVVIKAAAIT